MKNPGTQRACCAVGQKEGSQVLNLTKSVLIIALIAASVAASAGTFTVSNGDHLGIVINSVQPVVEFGHSAAVRGNIVLNSSAPLSEGMKTILVDGSIKMMTDSSVPTYALNTAELADGVHSIRIDCTEGQMLIASTGTLPLHIYNTSNQAIFSQAPQDSPNFVKIRRKFLKREMVWFNEREGDLEKHAIRRGGRTYITLSDLFRHIGGTIIWGPSDRYIEVTRSGMTIRVIPNSSVIYIDGVRRSLGGTAFRLANRTYVPVEPMCKLYDIDTQWNTINKRLMVTLN